MILQGILLLFRTEINIFECAVNINKLYNDWKLGYFILFSLNKNILSSDIIEPLRKRMKI